MRYRVLALPSLSGATPPALSSKIAGNSVSGTAQLADREVPAPANSANRAFEGPKPQDRRGAAGRGGVREGGWGTASTGDGCGITLGGWNIAILFG
ncbi:hypothetical protein GA0070215_103282 [Micromonospora marina]|uniref:Uncharacterized protein n=1 Tax=Micromonospora marina TaxID=307120 RepID=A0A1C4VN47_9ACTN|nr:hypothetical protein GA0070215_103282 [Micromonospora marina]